MSLFCIRRNEENTLWKPYVLSSICPSVCPSVGQSTWDINNHIQVKAKNISFAKLGSEKCEVCVIFDEHVTCDEGCRLMGGGCAIKEEQPEHERRYNQVTVNVESDVM